VATGFSELLVTFTILQGVTFTVGSVRSEG